MKVPKALGACADRLMVLREKKAKLTREIEKLEEERRAIEERLIDELPKDEASGVVGKIAKAVVTRREVPTVKDWDRLYDYVLMNKDFSLLQRRVSESAVKERWEAGETVPGVDKFTVIGVSITKP